jgi:cellulose synthase/poly-beta-1,6-N-acetylglucosamine synthase-like glycosyltransferase
MHESAATVAVIPRERFDYAPRSLDSLLAHTAAPYDLVYIDGGAPSPVRRALAAAVKGNGFRMIRRDHYLTPNEARNLATPEVRTKYVAFVDNDVIFAPTWLDHLVACAEETGADIVTPLICIGEPVHTNIHFAGGAVRIEAVEGKNRLIEIHHLKHERRDDVQDSLARQPTALGEFHCMLVRASLLRRLGPFDPLLRGTGEHLDFCLAAMQAGARIFFEPRSLVTFVPPERVALRDLPYFLLRWSDAWAVDTERYLHRKWKTEVNEGKIEGWLVARRREAVPGLYRLCRMLMGWRMGNAIVDGLARAVAAAARRRRPSNTRPTAA